MILLFFRLVVDERVEHELLSVHQMKFEIGGLYDKDDDDQVPIDAQIDSFIDQITGKDGRFSISSAIEGIENQKNEKGRDGLNDEISHGRDIILAKLEAQNDDSGIGLDLDKSRMSSTEEVPDEADGQECVMADSGRKELVDGEFLDKAKVYGEKEPPATAQPKRRMSDLDVHLKMMNDKSSRFFQPNPDEYPELDGPTNVDKHGAEKDSVRVHGDTHLDNTEEKNDDELSLTHESQIESKKNDKNGDKPMVEVDIKSSSELGMSISKSATDIEKKAGNKQDTKDDTPMTKQDTTENKKSDEAGAKEGNSEDVDLLDDMLEFLKNNRKGSRRSMTTDSGLGDDDYR